MEIILQIFVDRFIFLSVLRLQKGQLRNKHSYLRFLLNHRNKKHTPFAAPLV